ncbi:MAG: septal ring lytic transglycosylase RlpA family protein [Burkholderiales bacterium]|nr:septal ring lytic transglycosylase RlpA family protein [Burkholderiales bacterium]
MGAPARGWLMLAAAVTAAGCAGVRREPAPPPEARPPVAAQTPAAPRPDAPVARPGRGAYYQDDGPGDNPPPNLEATPDAVPVDEPPLRSAANRPYVVFGRTYTPLASAGGFRQRGIGSWYGRKFHGQRTSSGEPYDMYAMTAAHPTLPLPSYVRVTNPANGRSVIVRVNDRGPFHSDRVIDLSYTAALKLGYANQGSALVEIERVTAAEIAGRGRAGTPVAAAATGTAATAGGSEAAPARVGAAPAVAVLPTSAQPDGVYLQLGAFGARDGAEEFRIKTYQQLPWLTETMIIVARDGLHRVQLGPFASRPAAQAVADRIREVLQLKPMFVLR